MKIGIDARMYSSSFTGIGRYVFELIQNLAKLDKKTEFIVFLNPSEFRHFKKPGKNFRAVRVDARHYSPAEQTSFLAALIKERLDLMHFTHFNAPLLYLGRSVTTIHDLTLSKYPGQKMVSPLHRLAYNLVLRRAVSHASQLIAVSRNTKKDLRNLLDLHTKPIEVIYNGIGSEFKPAKSRTAVKAKLAKKYNLKSDFLLYAGVWRDHKNLLGLFEAFARLRQTRKFASKLVITGRPDPIYAPTIYAKVKELGLDKAVIFAGLVPEADLIQFYQAARVFVFPSFYEGFGLPPLEAMATGTPVAASNTSSIPEVCGAGNAVFFDPKNHDEMATAIYRAWHDVRLRKQLIAAGKKRVKEFNWQQMAKETLAVYRAALDK
jgi:hypothetical protein